MTGLAPRTGRDEAHGMLHAICHDPRTGEKSPTDLLLAPEDVMEKPSWAEIRALIDPEASFSLAEATTGRMLQQAR